MVIELMFLSLECGYSEIATWHFSNSEGGVDTQIILDDLKNCFGYNQEHLYSYMKIETTMTITSTNEGEGYDVEFAVDEKSNGNVSDLISWGGKENTSIDSLQTDYGLTLDFDKLSQLPVGEKIVYPVILVCRFTMNDKGTEFDRDDWNKGFDFTGELDCYFHLAVDMFWNDIQYVNLDYWNDGDVIEDITYGRNKNLEDFYGDNLYEMDYTREHVDSIENEVIEAVLPDWARNLRDHPFESILDILLWIIRGIGDFFQIMANFAQTPLDGDASHFGVTYTYDELISQGSNGAANKYTKVSEYKEDDVVEGTTIPAQNIPLANEDNDLYGFTKDTRIPVIKVDLYTMGANKVGLLDANFLDPDSIEHGSVWLKIRNFIVPLIYAMLYITAACLISTLIWHGIQIVRSSFTSPEKRKEHIEGLQKFVVSVVLLVGVLVVEALCIYASNLFLEDVTGIDNNSELPIRVNVQGAYSFSTTPTGYCRYMSEIENLNLIEVKALYTFGYLVLALFNCAFMLVMLARMLAMMLLAVVGYVIVLINLFSKENSSNWRFTDWVILYAGIAFLQVFLALVSRIILKTCF